MTCRIRSTRRTFLGHAAAASALLLPRRSNAGPPSHRVRVAIIGLGNQGLNHIRALRQVAGVEITAVCDIDESRRQRGSEQAGGVPASRDLRKVLDDPSTDAVTIATPDHWHTPAALLALKSGKHVYVEKPCSHNIREGRMLVNVAKQSGKIVAHGTQARSSAGMKAAIEHLQDGLIGDILVAKCWNWQRRRDIGKVQPATPPPGVDYDTWVGPAEWLPYQSNRFHYDWHWWYNFGCGGIGNDGAHELDYTLWGLGVDAVPSLVSAVGGNYFFRDDRQFPDTQQVSYEFDSPGKPRQLLIYEQRLWSTTYPFNVDSGAEFYGTKGKMFLSKRGKIQVLGERNAKQPVSIPPTKSQVVENIQNWIDCIRSGDTPNASLDAAHRVASTIHLGNIAARIGRTIRFDPASETVRGDEEANRLLGRAYREKGHWGVPDANLLSNE